MAKFDKFDTPPPGLIQPAKTWIADEGPKMHAAFGTQSRFDYQRAEYTRRQPHIDLAAAIRRYEELADKQAVIDVGSKQVWTWDDVLEEAENARKEYVAAGQGAKGAIRGFFRRVGDNEPSLSPWLCLISNESYLSLLHFGLALMFAAARTMSERRTQIIHALEDMPETIELANAVWKIFHQDEHLESLLIDLEHSLLDAIDNMISWLLEKSGKRFFKAVMKGSQFGAVIDDQLRRVEKRVADLRHHVDVLNYQSNAKTVTTLQRIEPQISRIRQMNTITAVQTRSIQDDVSDVKQNMIDLLNQTTGIASQNEMLAVLVDQIWKSQSQTRMAMKEQDKKLQLLREESAANKRVQGEQLESYATKPQLLELLGVDPSVATSDFYYVLKQGPMAEASPDAKCLMQTQQFQDWLSRPASAFIFVNGSDAMHALSRISPLSVLGSMISLGLNQLPNATSIHFYCGLHTSPADSISGPRGLMRSLIAQLLLADVNFDLHFIYSRQYFAELELHNIDFLCDTFEQLIRRLPADSTLFCLIDGVVFFDRSNWQDDLSIVVPKLTALAAGRSRIGPLFKLLMTNAQCSRWLRELVPPQDHLELSDVLSLGQEAITEQEINSQMLKSTTSLRRLSGTTTTSMPTAETRDVGDDIDDLSNDGSDQGDHESEIDDYNEWPV